VHIPKFIKRHSKSHRDASTEFVSGFNEQTFVTFASHMILGYGFSADEACMHYRCRQHITHMNFIKYQAGWLPFSLNFYPDGIGRDIG
jgi:hypothetical protein